MSKKDESIGQVVQVANEIVEESKENEQEESVVDTSKKESLREKLDGLFQNNNGFVNPSHCGMSSISVAMGYATIDLMEPADSRDYFLETAIENGKKAEEEAAEYRMLARIVELIQDDIKKLRVKRYSKLCDSIDRILGQDTKCFVIYSAYEVIRDLKPILKALKRQVPFKKAINPLLFSRNKRIKEITKSLEDNYNRLINSGLVHEENLNRFEYVHWS